MTQIKSKMQKKGTSVSQYLLLILLFDEMHNHTTTHFKIIREVNKVYIKWHCLNLMSKLSFYNKLESFD